MLFERGPVSGLDDGELLDRFVRRRDEAAFSALVTLHGPAVLGVCRRILHNPHDVEDAFQATFLVLVRRADAIRDPQRLAPWLHGVARRVALRARADAARRQAQVYRMESVASNLHIEPEHAEVRGAIDEEVGRLPARYRDAVILCDLVGRS
jgi:RNA polymerase sigma factor (sigma-70 family)